MWISFRQEPKKVLTAPTVSTWEEAGASPPTDFSDRMAWPESLVVLDCFLGRMNLFLFRILTMYYSPFVLSRCILSLFLLSFEFTSRCLFATEPDDILKTRKAKKRGRFGVHLTCVVLAVLLPRPCGRRQVRQSAPVSASRKGVIIFHVVRLWFHNGYKMLPGT